MSNISRFSNNISFKFKERDEFIKNFQKKKYNQDYCITSPKKININSNNNRWNYLYNLNKLKKIENKEKRERQRLLTEEKELKECTFIPNINNGISYIYNKENNNNKIKKNNSFINLNLFQRQKLWIEKKDKNIKKMKNKKKRDEMEECLFVPEINDKNAINKIRLKKKTINLIEDPESYSMYIKRLKNKREQINKKNNENKLKPGNGNIWNKINKNKKLDCEYSIKRLSKSNSKRKYEFDKIKLYENLYKKNMKLLNDPYGKEMKNNNYNLKKNKLNKIEEESFYNCPIEYGKAINILHTKLYSINLDSEDEDEKDYIF